MNKYQFFIVSTLALLITSCSVARVDHIPVTTDHSKKHLAIFFDGTHNEESSHTNVAKLHNLVSLQDNEKISTTYIRGVGTGLRIIGMGMGWGIGHDVRDAYLFLTENYNKGDKISIYGFSRGAFSARILSAMLYVSGLPSLDNIKPSDRESVVEDIYDAYKNEILTLCQRRNKVAEVYNEHGLAETINIKECDKNNLSQTKYPLPVNVHFMGLWDTVEALGWPDHDYSPGEANTRYADQLCNVKNVAHALSLDDNRARIFTPMLLSQKHILDETCDIPKDFSTNLNEVWFSGAHSDVGGGNNTDISGVSLNWMLDMMREAKVNLLSKDVSVYGNHLAKTHEGDSGFAGVFYKKVNRDLSMYIQCAQYKDFFCQNDQLSKGEGFSFISEYDMRDEGITKIKILTPELKIHQSVLDRLCVIPSKNFESKWYKQKPFQGCIECKGSVGFITDTDNCNKLIKAVKSDLYKSRDVYSNDNVCDESICWEAEKEGYKGYKDFKSCNYSNTSSSSYASERLKVRYLAKKGDKAEITFYADKDEDHSGVYLKKDMRYQVCVLGFKKENWKDCNNKNETNYANGRALVDNEEPLSRSTLISLLFYPLAHSYEIGYMGLLGQINGENYLIGKLVNNQVLTPRDDGELILRVNEPQFMDLVYTNNFGRLKLSIKAIGDDEFSPCVKQKNNI